jgi:hypothetical protein
LSDRAEPRKQRIIGVSAASRKPAKITGLRPIWSESQPNKINVGVPITSPAPTI